MVKNLFLALGLSFFFPYVSVTCYADQLIKFTGNITEDTCFQNNNEQYCEVVNSLNKKIKNNEMNQYTLLKLSTHKGKIDTLVDEISVDKKIVVINYP